MILLCMANQTTFAENYYVDHAVGWHWYDDPKEKTKVKTHAENLASNDPNMIVNAARKKITTALNTVIAQPTIENVENYIALQEQLSNRAERVGELWQQVLLKNPALNYSLTHPTNNVALQVYHEEESKKKEAAIRLFAKETGLFFFYKSACSYCQRFAPILKNFAERNGLTIVPITLDGISLQEFPNSRKDSGQAAKFHVKMTPSLFAVNPYTQKAFPVAYGLTSETELRDNIYKIMSLQYSHNEKSRSERGQ